MGEFSGLRLAMNATQWTPPHLLDGPARDTERRPYRLDVARSARTQVWPHAYRVLNAVDRIDDADRQVEPRRHAQPPKTAVRLIGNAGALGGLPWSVRGVLGGCCESALIRICPDTCFQAARQWKDEPACLNSKLDGQTGKTAATCTRLSHLDRGVCPPWARTSRKA
jgi:hypothetical protein